jgi:sulfur relay (sulfurtransferase) DsrC/TusE family protein
MESKGFLSFSDHIVERKKLCDDKNTLRDFVYSLFQKYRRHIPFNSLVKSVQSKFSDKKYDASHVNKVIDELIGRSLIFETYQNTFTIIIQ